MGLRLGLFYGGVGSSMAWVLQVSLTLRSFGELRVEV